MKKLLIFALIIAGAVIIGCQDKESASNNPWTIRAKSRIEMQKEQDRLEEYFARYEENFLANERKYYRLDDLPKGPDDNYYAQGQDDPEAASDERDY